MRIPEPLWRTQWSATCGWNELVSPLISSGYRQILGLNILHWNHVRHNFVKSISNWIPKRLACGAVSSATPSNVIRKRWGPNGSWRRKSKNWRERLSISVGDRFSTISINAIQIPIRRFTILCSSNTGRPGWRGASALITWRSLTARLYPPSLTVPISN